MLFPMPFIKLSQELEAPKYLRPCVVAHVAPAKGWGWPGLVDVDTILWLLYLLASLDVQDNGMAELLDLSKHSSVQRTLVEASGVGLIVDATNVGPLVVSVLRRDQPRLEGSADAGAPLAWDDAYQDRKNVVVSLHGLLRCAYSHWRAVNTGIVPVLIGLLSSPTPSDGDDLTIDSCAWFVWLAEQPVGAQVVLASSTLVVRPPRGLPWRGGRVAVRKGALCHVAGISGLT
jgi:hypothetical protein